MSTQTLPSAEPASQSPSASTQALRLVALIALCYAVAALGGWSTMEGVRSWYPTLDKPPWTPPNAAFGPIWSFLYTAMAVGVWDALRKDPGRSRTIGLLFAGQLLLNLVWSPLFFGAQATGPALAVISLLWVALAGIIPTYWTSSRLAGVLYVPYLAWISIAWSLNAWIWWFN